MKLLFFPMAASLAVAAFAPSSTAASPVDGLADCARIASPLDRLECFDALASSVGAVPAAPIVAAPSPAPEPVAAPTPDPVTQPAPTPAPVAETPPPAPPVVATRAEEFGFENERLKKDKTEVVANYDGQFTGWSGGTLFKLDNGQVWKQSQSGRVSYKKDRPEITIRRGAFGSYRLSVEGLNRTVRVKRVK